MVDYSVNREHLRVVKSYSVSIRAPSAHSPYWLERESPSVIVSCVPSEEVAPWAAITARSRSLKAREARLLFRANPATCGHSQGRKARNHANRFSRNCPLASTKRSVDGKLEIVFVGNYLHHRECHSSQLPPRAPPQPLPCRRPALRTNLAASPSAPGSPPIRNSPVRPHLRSRFMLLPSPAFTSRRGSTMSPTFSPGSSAPAKPTE